MGRERVERPGLGEERVDPLRAPPFEVVAARRCALEDRLEVGPGRRDLVGLEGARDRGVAGLSESGDDLLYDPLTCSLPKGMSKANPPEGNVKG